MTYAGARTETADQMAKTLHFPLGQERLHPTFAALQQELNAPGKKRGYELSVANALWGQKGYGFLPQFLQVTRDNYGAGLNEVDFVRATEEARKTINAWVEKETKDKIKELLKPGVLDVDTRLVLTNAIYFKGDWAKQFKKDQTRDEPFRIAAGKSVKVPMMHQYEAPFGYFESDTLQALQLPYEGKELSMVVLLPKKVDGLPELEKSLTADRLADVISKIREQDVNVALPKFKVTAEFKLNDELAKLGMPLAFTMGRADFSGMNGDREKLFISAVVHKAFVDVNEQGTEAAAATGVVIKTQSARIVPTFRADHPFLFVIRDNRSHGILFLGRLVNPQS
jgi:serpin B